MFHPRMTPAETVTESNRNRCKFSPLAYHSLHTTRPERWRAPAKRFLHSTCALCGAITHNEDAGGHARENEGARERIELIGVGTVRALQRTCRT